MYVTLAEGWRISALSTGVGTTKCIVTLAEGWRISALSTGVGTTKCM